MQGESTSEDKHLIEDRIWGVILLCGDKIQINVYEGGKWVDDLIAAPNRYGVKAEEQFRSPCG